MGNIVIFYQNTKKKEYRCTPTLLTLKSNTMKNTDAKIRTLYELARKTIKKVCFITLFRRCMRVINKYQAYQTQK